MKAWMMCGFAWVLAGFVTFVRADELVVQWPTLRALDEAAEEAEALGDASMERWREMTMELKNATQAVLTNGAPDLVKNRPLVEQYLHDLSDLASLIAEPGQMALEDMKMAAEAFHPLVVSIMEEAGLPHVHDHDHEHHGHGHDGNEVDGDDDHDHDHGEEGAETEHESSKGE